MGGTAIPARRWGELTREEITARAHDAVAVLPVAAIEQHGPHLAVQTDTAILNAVVDRAVARIPDGVEVLIAPTLCYGASDHHLPFGGTLSLTATTLRLVLTDLVRSVAAAGCRRVLLLNGHGGNALTCCLVANETAASFDITVGAASYWELLPQHGLRFPVPGHAGQFETSLMLQISSDLVRDADQRPPPATQPMTTPGMHVARGDLWQKVDGFTDDPRGARAETGEQILAGLGKAVANAILALADPTPRPTSR